jgi:hypothetical protein
MFVCMYSMYVFIYLYMHLYICVCMKYGSMHDTMMVSLDFNYCLCVLVNLVLSFIKSLPIGVPAKESCSLKWFADWAAILLSSQKSRRSFHPSSFINKHPPLAHHRAYSQTALEMEDSYRYACMYVCMYVCNLAMSSDVLLLLLFSRIELLSSLRVVDVHFV